LRGNDSNKALKQDSMNKINMGAVYWIKL